MLITSSISKNIYIYKGRLLLRGADQEQGRFVDELIRMWKR